MGLGKMRKRRLGRKTASSAASRRPGFELLERREMFAVYLPDSFAHGDLQPVGTAFNGGEQIFFGGHSRGLQFEFGNSAAAITYAGTGWNQRDVDDLLTGSIDDVAGAPSLYEAAGTPGGAAQLHAVYRTTTGKIVDVWSTPWQSRELVSSGAASDPTATTLNGGRQVLYVGTDGHVHIVASADLGNTWTDTDLNALVGVGADASAAAVPTGGIASLQVGSLEYYVYNRADGALGYFLWSGSAWGYDVLDATDFAGYVAPTTGARGALEGTFYASDGGALPTVGWVLFRDGTGSLRGVWLAGGGPWRTAEISDVEMLGPPSAAFDPVNRQLNVTYVDSNAHLRLLKEVSPWTNLDFHSGYYLTMPLANLGGEQRASDTIEFNDGSTVTVIAEQAGTAFNDVTVDFVAGASLTALYDSVAKVITVTLPGSTNNLSIAAVIDDLAEFEAFAGSQFGIFSTVNDAFTTLGTLTGGTPIVPGNAVRPDIFYREHAVAGRGPGLHVLYKDQSNHLHNIVGTPSFPAVFDTTAYLEGYHALVGYGTVNAAAAVAYALNSSTPLAGAGSGAWNLSLIRAPSVWNTATGQNVAVFALDSGIDTANNDVLLLTGFNIAGNNTNTLDTNGHGTGVAGIIAGLNDGSGVTGVAYNARVVPVKIGDGSVLSQTAIADGLEFASDYALPSGYVDGTRVVNMSFASTAGTLDLVRDKMYQELPDTVFVLAAGNRRQETMDLPARYAVGYGIVAGAVNSASQLWSPTNGTAGASVPVNFLLAPGVGVTTLAPVGSSGNNHNTANVDGTSAAAAHISGVVALMLQANPDLTPREIESILIASAEQVVTQIFSATVPSINATIYWAGDEGPSAATGILLGEATMSGQPEAQARDEDVAGLPTKPVVYPETIVNHVLAKASSHDELDSTASSEEREELIELLARSLGRNLLGA